MSTRHAVAPPVRPSLWGMGHVKAEPLFLILVAKLCCVWFLSRACVAPFVVRNMTPTFRGFNSFHGYMFAWTGACVVLLCPHVLELAHQEDWGCALHDVEVLCLHPWHNPSFDLLRVCCSCRYYSGGQDYFSHLEGSGFDLHIDATPNCGPGCRCDVPALSCAHPVPSVTTSALCGLPLTKCAGRSVPSGKPLPTRSLAGNSGLPP
jgi:hypothetical protein